jgi:phosphoribosylformylglycinamidine cyclo-ligase
VSGADLSAPFDGTSLGRALLAPTRIYVRSVRALLADSAVKGIAHITGGGIVENVPRVLPDTVTAVLDRSTWTLPPVFAWLQERGNVEDAEMHRVFNCGIGMVLVVSAGDAEGAVTRLRALGENAWIVGTIEPRREGQAQTIVR